MKLFAIVLSLGLLVLAFYAADDERPKQSRGAVRKSRPKPMKFEATAYAISGITASGKPTREGRTVAADPEVIPLGSRIRVRGAGRYSGDYVVTDTGSAVKGRQIDIYVADEQEAERFGRREVTVTILSRGEAKPATGNPGK
ncbi:MAG: 3D domain-containing protein [Bryobacteraceae bacterium]